MVISWFKIKRWMILFSIGLLLVVFGTTIMFNYQIFGALEEELFVLAYQLTGAYSYTMLAAYGSILSIFGIVFMLVGIRKLIKRFIILIAPEEQNQVSRQVLGRIELSKGPHIAAIGGGHGLSMLLRGLRKKLLIWQLLLQWLMMEVLQADYVKKWILLHLVI